MLFKRDTQVLSRQVSDNINRILAVDEALEMWN